MISKFDYFFNLFILFSASRNASMMDIINFKGFR